MPTIKYAVDNINKNRSPLFAKYVVAARVASDVVAVDTLEGALGHAYVVGA